MSSIILVHKDKKHDKNTIDQSIYSHTWKGWQVAGKGRELARLVMGFNYTDNVLFLYAVCRYIITEGIIHMSFYMSSILHILRNW